MRFTDQKIFDYDSAVFKRVDTQIALKIHSEYVQKMAGRTQPDNKPATVFLEVSREPQDVDQLWHSSAERRTRISRELPIPAIVRFDKATFISHRMGRTREQIFRLWVSTLSLQENNYFPVFGDYVGYSGYRLGITMIEFPVECYWLQTGVLLGMQIIASVTPDGDALPAQDLTRVIPAETTNPVFIPKVDG